MRSVTSRGGSEKDQDKHSHWGEPVCRRWVHSCVPHPLPRCTDELELKQTLSREDSWVLILEPHVGSNGTCVGFDEHSS